MCLGRGTAGVAHPDGDNYLGDHATPHGNEGSAGEEADLLNNCYVLYCTRLMGKISAVLGAKTSSFLAPFDTTHKPNVCQDRLGDQHNIGKLNETYFCREPQRRAAFRAAGARPRRRCPHTLLQRKCQRLRRHKAGPPDLGVNLGGGPAVSARQRTGARQ